jgi:hypothetical protein
MKSSLNSKQSQSTTKGLCSYFPLDFQRNRTTIKLSFLSGFFCAVCLCYFVLFRHVITGTFLIVVLFTFIISLFLFSDGSIVDPLDLKSPSSSLSTVSSTLLSQSLRNNKLRHLEQSVLGKSSSLTLPESQKHGFYFDDKFYSVALQEKNLIIGKFSVSVPPYL